MVSISNHKKYIWNLIINLNYQIFNLFFNDYKFKATKNLYDR